MSESNTVTASDRETVFNGRVKWFNNKAGFGFVTVMGTEDKKWSGEDVFVHHSGIKVTDEQYKYLMQGEYVQFNWRDSDTDKHPYQAGEVTGMWGGKLMCETRNDNPRPARRRVRARGSGPREPRSSDSKN